MFKIFFFSLILSSQLYAKVDTLSLVTRNEKKLSKHLILPSGLIISGALIKETSYRTSFQTWVQKSQFRTNTKIDNYLQYIPIVELFGSDIFYSKSKNEVFQQTKNLAIAELLTAFLVQLVKRTTNIKRPNGHDFSYFSGHTSQSFTCATALFIEYKEVNPLIAYSGYGFSTATGILRVTNNKHWISDVLVGAGIGILSARLTWYINPLKRWKPFKNNKISISPQINGIDKVGLAIAF